MTKVVHYRQVTVECNMLALKNAPSSAVLTCCILQSIVDYCIHTQVAVLRMRYSFFIICLPGDEATDGTGSDILEISS